MYTYIKEVHFHLVNAEASFIVTGEEAQHLYHFGLDTDERFIEIRMNGIRRLVPQTSVVYIDVIENVEANELVEKIKQKYNAICVFANTPKDEHGWDYWMVQGGVLYIKYEDGPEPLSNDPKVVKLAQNLLDQQNKLEQILSSSNEQKEII